MNVEALMQKRVATVQETDWLDRAAAAMCDKDVGCVVVVGKSRRPLAVLTDRDVCIAAFRSGKPLSSIRVDYAMSSRLFTCRREDTIAEVEKAMSLHQVRRLPVVDDRKELVGLIALDDIAREAWRDEDLLAPPVSSSAVGVTLGQIARSRLIESDSAKATS